jgi:hypothetical protein
MTKPIEAWAYFEPGGRIIVEPDCRDENEIWRWAAGVRTPTGIEKAKAIGARVVRVRIEEIESD